jgi:hypothetical protein
MASNTAMVKIMEISTLKYSPMTYFPHCIMKNGHFIQQPLESTENMLNHIILLFFLLINQAQRTIRNKYQQKEKIIVSFHIQFSCIQASWMTRFQWTDWAIISNSQYINYSDWNIINSEHRTSYLYM